jgi:hypothetical protein
LSAAANKEKGSVSTPGKVCTTNSQERNASKQGYEDEISN